MSGTITNYPVLQTRHNEVDLQLCYNPLGVSLWYPTPKMSALLPTLYPPAGGKISTQFSGLQ